MMSSFLLKEAYIIAQIVIKDDNGAVEMMTSLILFFGQFLTFLTNLFLFYREIKSFFIFIANKIEVRYKIGQIIFISLGYGLGI